MLNANSTRCSQAVTHPSTNRAQRYLTAVIGREPVFSTGYGRWRTEYSGCSLLDFVSQYVIYTHCRKETSILRLCPSLFVYVLWSVLSDVHMTKTHTSGFNI